MNLSMKWLNDYLPAGELAPRSYCEGMTMSGSKVEGYKVEGAEIQNVVVGQVKAMERHPDSDHLWVCQVDVGTETVQIVTGAQNVSAGDFVPVAKHKSVLPGGHKITKGKLRGVESCGMLCSLGELGLTAHDFPYAIEDGIFILGEDCDRVLGKDIQSAIGLNDTTVEFEITSNRPDCFSILGLARETAATFGLPMKTPAPVVKGCGGDIHDYLRVEVKNGALCPRYMARVVKDVKIAPSPRWMRERLRNMGVRPINNIVDITNYVMLEYGQPMHAFDYRYVKGGKIVVRRARDGEELTTLDGNAYKLSSSMLVIADENRAVGLAGIMGGLNSEIVEDTVDVVFESANFDGACIRRTALALGKRTEASAKFEKGLDILNTLPAVNRACELVELLGAGEVVDGVIDLLNYVPQPRILPVEPEKINALLGISVAENVMYTTLQKLGFETVRERGMMKVPSWRSDVEGMADLAEEVARFYGYNNIPNTLSSGLNQRRGWNPVQQAENAAGALCRGLGYSEIITYSFISPTYYDKINLPADSPLRDSMKILNPLGEDTSIMRTTTLPSMLEILARNCHYRNKAVRLYELGRTYFAKNDGSGMADEPKVLSLGAYGGGMDFFEIKGAVEALLEGLRIEGFRFEAETANPSYHPGRCAKVYCGDRLLGTLGQIHPAVAENYSADCELYAAELDFTALFDRMGGTPIYQPLPRFPAVTRDIALLCDKSLPVAKLEECIRQGAKGLLKAVTLFDVYTGKGVPEGKKSVAFNLELRADDRSLTAQEADEDVKGILDLLSRELDSVLR